MTTRTSALVARSIVTAGLALAVTAASSAALAQTPPPEGYPPPGYPPAQGYPPPGYPPPQGYPPPGAYGPPGAYYAPPPGGGYAGPRIISDYEEGQTIPPGYHKDTRIRGGLVGAGAGLLGGFWLVTALSSVLAADLEKQGSIALGAIPVAGPFTLITQCGGYASCDFAAVLDGVVQVAGLAMLIGGLAAPKTVLVRNDVGKVTIMPKPMTFGKAGAGAGLVATF